MLSQGEREEYQRVLAWPGTVSFTEREPVVALLLLWLDTYDARCAEVVRLSLAGATDVPWRGYRSVEGLKKVAVIVERLREEQDAVPAAQPRRGHRATARRR